MDITSFVDVLLRDHNPDRDKNVMADLYAAGAMGLPVTGVEVQPNNFQKLMGIFGVGGKPTLRPLRLSERWRVQEGKNRAAQIKGAQAQRKFEATQRAWELADRPTKLKLLQGRLAAQKRAKIRYGWEKETQDYLRELRPLVIKLRKGELSDAETRRADYLMDRAHTLSMRPIRDALAKLQLETGLTAETEHAEDRPFEKEVLKGKAKYSADTDRRIDEAKKAASHQTEQWMAEQVDQRVERERKQKLFDAKMQAVENSNQAFQQTQADQKLSKIQELATQFLASDPIIQQYEPQKQVLEATRKELMNIAAGKRRMNIAPSEEEQQKAAQKITELSETIFNIDRLQKLRAQLLARQSAGGEGPTLAEREMLTVLTDLLSVPKDPAAQDDYFKTRLNPLTGDDFTPQTLIPGASIPNAFNQFWWSLAGRP